MSTHAARAITACRTFSASNGIASVMEQGRTNSFTSSSTPARPRQPVRASLAPKGPCRASHRACPNHRLLRRLAAGLIGGATHYGVHENTDNAIHRYGA